MGRVHVDIAFTRWKVAAFVDGCFWHSCPIHGSLPKSNAEYWIPKLTANVTRDRATDKVLANAGWLVVRAWEHEDVTHIVDRVVDALDRAKRS